MMIHPQVVKPGQLPMDLSGKQTKFGFQTQNPIELVSFWEGAQGTIKEKGIKFYQGNDEGVKVVSNTGLKIYRKKQGKEIFKEAYECLEDCYLCICCKERSRFYDILQYKGTGHQQYMDQTRRNFEGRVEVTKEGGIPKCLCRTFLPTCYRLWGDDCFRPIAYFSYGNDPDNTTKNAILRSPCTAMQCLCPGFRFCHRIDYDLMDANENQKYHFDGTCCQWGRLCYCCKCTKCQTLITEILDANGKQVGEIRYTLIDTYNPELDGAPQAYKMLCGRKCGNKVLKQKKRVYRISFKGGIAPQDKHLILNSISVMHDLSLPPECVIDPDEL
jgi:hypothetical protein